MGFLKEPIGRWKMRWQRHYLYQKLKEDFYGNGSFAARSDCGEENCVECVEKDFSPRTLVYKVKKNLLPAEDR